MAIQPVSAVGREDQAEEQYDLLAQSLKKQEESRTTLHEMIQDAKEKANDQREKFKLAKATPAAASSSWRPPSGLTRTMPTRSAPPSAS